MASIPSFYSAAVTAVDNAQSGRHPFTVAAARFDEVARSAPVGGWDRETPCPPWVARDIVRHLVEWIPDVIGRSGHTITVSADVDVDPLSAWRDLASELQRLLDDPAIAHRTFDAGPPGELSIANAIRMLVVGDVLVHTWDLAEAFGRSVQLDDALVAEQLAGLAQFSDALVASGHFAAAVAVPDGASPHVRMLALTGRDAHRSSADGCRSDATIKERIAGGFG